VLRIETDYPEELHLHSDRSPGFNGARIESHLGLDRLRRIGPAALQPGAVTAAICAPLATDTDIPVVGSDAQPIRDALPTFNADMGGVRWLPSPMLTDVDTGTSWGVWLPADDDADPMVPKVCATIDCETETSAELEALYRCIELTNFQFRYSRDLADANMANIRTAFARFAETRRLLKIAAGSTAITHATETLGLTRAWLNGVDLDVARLRRRYRIPADQGFAVDFLYPDWMHAAARVDIASALPGGDVEDNMALADEALSSWLRARGLRPFRFYDGETTAQTMAEAQAAGAALAWPATVIDYMYPTGTWLRLDGGTMDLGVVRDSTLNETNRLRIFVEDFENVIKRGPLQSLRRTTTGVPNGAVSGTVTPPATVD
jgi:hypothetical protein